MLHTLYLFPLPHLDHTVYYAVTTLSPGFHYLTSSGRYIIQITGEHLGSSYGFTPVFNSKFKCIKNLIAYLNGDQRAYCFFSFFGRVSMFPFFRAWHRRSAAIFIASFKSDFMDTSWPCFRHIFSRVTRKGS